LIFLARAPFSECAVFEAQNFVSLLEIFMKINSQFVPVAPSLSKRVSKLNQRGFSMVEMLIVIAVGTIVTAIGFITLAPAMKEIRVSNAYNTTLATLRQAREMAVSNRDIYMVTLNNTVVPNTITITDTNPANPKVVETMVLPNDVNFDNEPGIPNTATTTPDNFGTGGAAIDFDQAPATGAKNVIYFYPDGAARDSTSALNNGVVYIARPGELMSSHAISLWGATGRLRGWQLINKSGKTTWSQM
jgi:prepilin-type N-terminal cleavage/methylation domain-containing protein